MVQGVIFDLDGVICSTDEFHYLAWKALADKEGIPFDRETNNLLRGVSRMASLEIILRKATRSYSEEEKAALADYKNELYRGYLKQMTPADLDPNVLKTLQTLKEKGMRIAIGSSSKNTKTILTNLGIIDVFDAIADGNDIQHSKPDPEVFLVAARKLGLEPSSCIVVEDAFAGIEAAKRGGFVAAAIGDAVKDPDADFVLSALSDILPIALS
ncbi:MAG: beta-phosphoglucomutase [Candidatus Enteromonas sp.]